MRTGAYNAKGSGAAHKTVMTHVLLLPGFCSAWELLGTALDLMLKWTVAP